MPVMEAVQTFVGIANENEFYSHHYLSEVLQGDIKERLEQWAATEAAHPEQRAPYKQLTSRASQWFALRNTVSHGGTAAEQLDSFQHVQQGLLQALGYTIVPQHLELQAGMPVLVWQVIGDPGKAPQVLVVPAYNPGQEEDDILDQRLSAVHYAGVPVPPVLADADFASIVSDGLFGADQAPRFIILVGLQEWLLLDRFKWPNSRALRFDWSEMLDRKDPLTLQAAAALLHRDSLAPDNGASLLESLDENAHRHAFGVSEDLKYAIREAIEALGNEAVRQLRQQAVDARRGFFSGKGELDPEQLSLECLRLVYRLLFLFYIEARPELGYVPIRTSEVYLKGYSLESLRDLELTPLHTPQSRDGFYFDHTLRRLFTLVTTGCAPAVQQQLTAASVRDAFVLAPLDSRLFDAASTPLLNRVRFPNHIWQRVIRLMSLSGGKGRKKGRVSYQLLSINQLGAVYEALLSYRGFFATEDLYEVMPERKQTRATHDDDDDDDDAGDAEGGGSTDVLDNAWFVPASRIGDYKNTEKVYDVDDAGHRKLRKYERGIFIYRLAGRDREKSASYYTPQVLTRCLVKYALKELLQGKAADDILRISVCEPAMGSAAFLNEAINQLAEKYLQLKQAELGRRIPHDAYPRELQKVRMYLADHNAFGVDLNPVAVELAEVSLWLNAIYGEAEAEDDAPRQARVPWFGYQLFAGNSLIGARREVYRASQLVRNAKPAWYGEAPRRLDSQHPVRQLDEIYHFLLPDPGMASYTDKVARKLYAEDFERLKQWRKEFIKPLERHEIARLQQLSAMVDDLWQQHTRLLARDREATEDPLPVWPAVETHAAGSTRATKEAIRKRGLLNDDGDLATPFRRLKLVMDYWCALWFWPIRGSGQLPSREQWWMEIGAILEGNVVDLTPQPQFDFALTSETQPELPGLASATQLSLLGAGQQTAPASAPTGLNLHDRFGQLRISRLREHFPRVKTVEDLATAARFLHWELNFADVFARRGGFDLVLGNPPWIKVEWKEAGILGEKNPLFAIRKISASDLGKLRDEAFMTYPGLQDAWTAELEQAEATQNFLNGMQNYPVLRQTDKASAPAHAQAAQVTLKRVELAFQAFFRRVKAGDTPGYPRFKSLKHFKGWGYKTHGDGWRLQPRNGMQHGRLWLSGIGHVKMRGNARTAGEPQTCELTYRQGTWYASVTLVCTPERTGGTEALGLDWGIETYATLAMADGTREPIDNPRWLGRAQERLQAASRARDHKTKGSCAWKAMHHTVATLHGKAARQRQDFLHKVSATLVSRAALIATEALQIANLSKRPKAKQDDTTGQYLPNGASQKAGRNRAILDGAPATFLAMLRYKAAEAGTVYAEAHTQRLTPSQTCHQCHRRGKKSLSERWHTCICGASCGRDANSALALRDWGIEHLYVILLAWLASHKRSQELAPCHTAQNLPLEPQA